MKTKTGKEFNELRKNNKEIIQKYIRINSDYQQAAYDAMELSEELEQSMENPIVKRYEELLDIMEKEEID